jgi:hypothetical protein
VTYLSSQRMHDPCVRTGTSISCARQLGALRAGAVLVSWTRAGFPGLTLANAPGRRTTFAGRPSKLDIARPGACADIGAEETVTARISAEAPENYVEMQACLRGPSLAARERQVLALLGSLRFRTKRATP